MPLRKCPDCNGEVSTAANICPKCGYPFWGMRAGVLVPFYAALVFISVGGFLLYQVTYPLRELSKGPLHGEPFDVIRQLGWGAVGLGVLFLVTGIVLWRRNRGRM